MHRNWSGKIDLPQSSDSDMLTLIKLDAQKLARFTNMIDLPQSSDSDMLTLIKLDAQKLVWQDSLT